MTLIKEHFMPESLAIAQCISYSRHCCNKELDRRRVHFGSHFGVRAESIMAQREEWHECEAAAYVVTVAQEQRGR